MKPLLILSEGRTLGGAPLDAHGAIEVRRVSALPAAATLDRNRPTVVLLDGALAASAERVAGGLPAIAARAALVTVGEPGEPEPAAGPGSDLATGVLPAGASPALVAAQLRGAFRHAASIMEADHARYRDERSRRELTDLTRVGVALSTERNLTTLLEMIVSQARRITWSDAASLYLVERNADGTPGTTLRFKLSQNHSLPDIPFSEFTVPIDHTSLAGYAAATGEVMAIEDVYLLPEDVPYKQNRSFDDKFGYRTKSMLVLPMKTHREEVIGVLQLINRKRRFDAVLTSPEGGEREVLPYKPARSGAGDRVGGAGRRGHREQPALRGHREAIRRVRDRRRHRHRVARSDHVGPFRAGGHAHRGAGRSGEPGRRGPLQDAAIQCRADSGRSATPGCCTTSARSACASRCW